MTWGARCLLGLISLALSGPRLWAQSAADPAVARGQAQFVQNCGFCHGADATGVRGPDLTRSGLVHADQHGELIAPVIKNGRSDAGMPPLSLTDAQIADVVAFLHARVQAAMASNRGPGRDYPLQKLLTGNAAAGSAYFHGPGGCSGCHSEASLAGIASKFDTVELQQRLLYPRGRDAVQVAVQLANGKTVSGRLLHRDEFQVALRDAEGNYHSFDPARVRVEEQDPLAAHRRLLGSLTDAELHNVYAFLATLK